MKRFAVLVVAALVVGCASKEEVSADMRELPDVALCVDYMTLPNYNIHQDVRAREIGRRGIDCTKYAELIAAKMSGENASVNCTSTTSGSTTQTNCR